MIGVDGVARIVDFGVAKATGRLQQTRDGQIKGKIRYMAPEQIKQGDLDRSVDIYAASVVLWECLTGKRLFDDQNEWQIASAVIDGCTEPPSKYAPELSAELDALVMRGLERDRAARFQTALEMATRLEEAVPPATPRQVANWLDHLASEVIRQRAEKLAAVEGSGSSSREQRTELERGSQSVRPSAPTIRHGALLPDLDDEASEPSRTAAGTASTLLPEGSVSRRQRRRVLLAIIGASVLTLFGVLVLRKREAPTVAQTPQANSAETPAEVARSAAVPDPPDAPVASAEPKLEPPKVTRSPHKNVPKREKPESSNCNPPYYFDADGVKHLKAECL